MFKTPRLRPLPRRPARPHKRRRRL